MDSPPLRIAVIGAGIGGLTAALSLRQAGFDVDVYEQAPELTQIGGGINMGPNAARILRRLGLGEGLDREGVRPRFTHQRRWRDGRTLQHAALNPLGAAHCRTLALELATARRHPRCRLSRPAPRALTCDLMHGTYIQVDRLFRRLMGRRSGT